MSLHECAIILNSTSHTGVMWFFGLMMTANAAPESHNSEYPRHYPHFIPFPFPTITEIYYRQVKKYWTAKISSDIPFLCQRVLERYTFCENMRCWNSGLVSRKSRSPSTAVLKVGPSAYHTLLDLPERDARLGEAVLFGPRQASRTAPMSQVRSWALT